jgi:hypothetical protein
LKRRPAHQGTLPHERRLPDEIYSRVDFKMIEIHQLASAMLAIAFAAVMLVAGQLFIEYRANKYPVQAVQTASLPL